MAATRRGVSVGPPVTEPAFGLTSKATAVTGRLDLWLTACSDCNGDLLEHYRSLLSDEELRRESRFVFARDRRRYLVTRALVRTVLSRYGPTPPAAWRFTTNPYGRPDVDNNGDPERALSFNLAHTSEMVLLGVTHGGPIGVDIEDVRHERAPLDVANHFFAANEVASLNALPPAARPERFFAYWTLKESYIKARGMGLSIPLDSFAFDLADADMRIGFSRRGPSIDDDARDWRFWQIIPAPGHLAAVCVACDTETAPTVSLRKVIPLSADQPLRCPLLRQTSP